MYILIAICLYMIIFTIYHKIIIKLFGSNIKSEDGWKIQKVFAVATISTFNILISFLALKIRFIINILVIF